MMQPFWFFLWPVVPMGLPLMVFSSIIIYGNNSESE